MPKGFLTYDLAVALYDQCESVQAKHYIKDQLGGMLC